MFSPKIPKNVRHWLRDLPSEQRSRVLQLFIHRGAAGVFEYCSNLSDRSLVGEESFRDLCEFLIVNVIQRRESRKIRKEAEKETKRADKIARKLDAQYKARQALFSINKDRDAIQKEIMGKRKKEREAASRKRLRLILEEGLSRLPGGLLDLIEGFVSSVEVVLMIPHEKDNISHLKECLDYKKAGQLSKYAFNNNILAGKWDLVADYMYAGGNTSIPDTETTWGNGRTPLQFVLSTRKFVEDETAMRIVVQLASKESNINYVNFQRKNALTIAIESKWKEEIIRFLVQMGAKPQPGDLYHKSTCSLARLRGYSEDLVRLLESF